MRAAPTFRQEFADFRRFLFDPRLGPRLRRSGDGPAWMADWQLNCRWTRLLAWAFCLWGINLLVLGPLALMAAGQGGATHRINIDNLPVLTAILWAPLVEELLFRYGLRRPAQALWIVPVMAVAVFYGPQLWTGFLVVAVAALAWHLTRTGSWPGAAGWRWRRRYVRVFGKVFHLASLTFAAIHLINYTSIGQMPYWLVPLLILPQWVTGLVVGWMRVRRGIGAAIALHALFNGGPVLTIWLLLKLLGGAPVAA